MSLKHIELQYSNNINDSDVDSLNIYNDNELFLFSNLDKYNDENIDLVATVDQINNLMEYNKFKKNNNQGKYFPMPNMIPYNNNNFDINLDKINPGWNLLTSGLGIAYNTKEKTDYYSGAGVMLFQRHSHEAKYLSVILFSLNGNEYQDLGGSIDDNDYRDKYTLQTTAKREAIEESGGYLNIQFDLDRLINNKNLYIDVTNENKCLYRCYLVSIDSDIFDNDKFYNNVSLIKKLQFPSSWKEINNVKTFRLTDLYDSLENKENTKNNIYNIRGRTKNILHQLFKNEPLLEELNDNTSFVKKQINNKTHICSLMLL